jgi:hypothetical protein
MEKLMERHMRDSVLKERPLHRNQHAYQIGKTIETALHNVVTCIEGANKCKEIALGALLNKEGAFGGTLVDVITQAAELHGTEPAICRWNSSVLEGRNIIITLSGETTRAYTDGMSAGRCTLASAVEPGHGEASLGAT